MLLMTNFVTSHDRRDESGQQFYIVTLMNIFFNLANAVIPMITSCHRKCKRSRKHRKQKKAIKQAELLKNEKLKDESSVKDNLE